MAKSKINAAAYNHGITVALVYPEWTPEQVGAQAADWYGQTAAGILSKRAVEFMLGHSWGERCRLDALDHRTGRPRIVTPATPQRAAEAPVIAWPGC